MKLMSASITALTSDSFSRWQAGSVGRTSRIRQPSPRCTTLPCIHTYVRTPWDPDTARHSKASLCQPQDTSARTMVASPSPPLILPPREGDAFLLCAAMGCVDVLVIALAVHVQQAARTAQGALAIRALPEVQVRLRVSGLVALLLRARLQPSHGLGCTRPRVKERASTSTPCRLLTPVLPLSCSPLPCSEDEKGEASAGGLIIRLLFLLEDEDLLPDRLPSTAAAPASSSLPRGERNGVSSAPALVLVVISDNTA